MSRHAPVLGRLGGEYMGGPFRTFDTGTVHGLAAREREHLQLLVLVARTPNAGHVGALLEACQRAYQCITIWEVMDDRLQAMLYRRGFVQDLRPAVGEDVADHVVFEWRRPDASPAAPPA